MAFLIKGNAKNAKLKRLSTGSKVSLFDSYEKVSRKRPRCPSASSALYSAVAGFARIPLNTGISGEIHYMIFLS